MQFLDNDNNSKRNNSDEEALLQESNEHISSITHSPQPASHDFQHALKMKILESRHKKFTMHKILNVLHSCMQPMRFAPVVAVLVIIAIVSQTMNIPSLIKNVSNDPFGEFSKLIISPAYAKDNFELEPETIDSLGVAGDTSYVLTSKESIDTDLIKNSLVVEPNVRYSIKKLSDTKWRITPDEPLPANTIFKVALQTSFYDDQDRLQSRDYAWAYQVKDSFKVVAHIPGDATTGVPTNSGIEIKFSHDNFINYEQYVSIEPSVEHRFEQHGRTLVLVPLNGLQKATVYTVTVKKGLPVSGASQALTEDTTFQFETTGTDSFRSGRSYFNVYEKFSEFTSTEKPVVQVYASNGDGTPVQVDVYSLGSPARYIDALNARDTIPSWAYSKDTYQYDVSGLSQVASFSTDVKKAQYVQFIDFPEALPNGYYAVNFTAGDSVEQSWFQVTNMSAYVNVTKTDTILWAHDMATDAPAAGATISILGKTGSYRADSRGVVKFETPQFLVDDVFEKPHYASIVSGNSQLIIPVSRTSRSYYYSGISDGDDYWRYLYTDRPKYQPTDVIKFWGMVKTRDGSRIDEEVTLELTKNGYVDYYYHPVSIASYDVTLNDVGTYEGDIALEGVRPDYYTIQLRVGDTVLASKYIEVRSYVKPAYQLTLTPDRTRAFSGETINFDVQASFFEGTPVPGLDLVFKMPEGDYPFTTDGEGRAHLTYTKRYQECNDNSYCWPKNVWLRVTPQDSELSEISASQTVYFYGPDVFMESDITYPEAGVGDLTVQTYQADLERKGGPRAGEDIPIAPNTRVTGDVTKITYEKRQTGTYYDFIRKQAYPRYQYDRREELVDQFSFLTDAQGKKTYRLTVEPETSYRVSMKVYDASGRYDRDTEYVYYYNGSKTNMYNSYYQSYYSFDFPSGTTYSIGDTVTADMSNYEGRLPDGDTDAYLFIQLQNGLQEYAVSNSSQYVFSFEGRDVPNIDLVGVYFKDGVYVTTDAGYYRSNRVSLNQKDRELQIQIDTDKDQYAPGEDATLSLRVTDAQGRGQQASVNVNVVDEAYYAVAADTASPLASIYAPVGSGSYYSAFSHKTLTDATAAEMGGCFLAGTEILMADGTTRPIEDVMIGDRVQTFSDPLRLIQDSGTVTKVFSHLVDEYLIINDTLHVTPEHLVYSNHSFRAAGVLKRGDWLLQSDGTKVFVKKIEIRHEPVMVYNFTVEPHHTYIADDFYVHNDKGDGVREFFTDAPLFKSVVTDRNGNASLTFTLPDNITSWRATVQAVSQSLSVGADTANINVSLPVFADVTVSSQYLSQDTPVIRMRAYGTALTQSDEVSFTVTSDTLTPSPENPITAKAFQAAYVELPALSVGTHDVLYSLKTARGEDAIRLPLKVITSDLVARSAEVGELTTETVLSSPYGGSVHVTLGSTARIQLVDPLQRLTWSWGDRVDQSIVRTQSRTMLNELLNEEKKVSNPSPYLYQQADGGIALLPYGGSDLELSARMALVAADSFDTQSLQQFFLNTFNSTSSNREEITLSLLGLAALDTPVMPALNNWRQRDDLSVKEYLYVALAAHELGADELARSIFYSVASQYAHEKSPDIIIKVSDNDSETHQLTALAAVLAASVDAPEHEGLWSSVRGFNWQTEVLVAIEKLAYIQESLHRAVPQDARVTYEVAGKQHEVSFDRSSLYSFEVLPQSVDSVRFTRVEGAVGITSVTERPIELADIERDADIGIRREYYVKGTRTNTFTERDLIEVRLYPTIQSAALDGNYQIVDTLPNGLIPVTKLYQGYYGSGCHAWYPYNIDGQKVKYNIWKSWNNYSQCGNYISYYARVKNRGTYAAEPALMQSLVNPEFINYSESGTITIP